MGRERTKEIRRTMAFLWDYWERHPHLRLGQIISELSPIPDPFYVKDEVFVSKCKMDLEVSLKANEFWNNIKVKSNWGNKNEGYLTRQTKLIRQHAEKTGMSLEDSTKAVNKHLRSEI